MGNILIRPYSPYTSNKVTIFIRQLRILLPATKNSHVWNIQQSNRSNVNVMIWFLVFNTTFNDISVILWRSVLLVEETREPGENH
jgi:hypothetical protein